MPDVISINDLTQQYHNCVILYKGKPHKVKQIGAQIQLLDLRSMRKKLVEFSMKDFAPPCLRLGYVNVDDTSFYVSRKPARLYQVGLNQNNCKFTSNIGARDYTDTISASARVAGMELPEFADMMLDHYPKLEDAVKQAVAGKGTTAFDKQFAVDSRQNIFYKGFSVGMYDDKIVFNKPYEYLGVLLGNEYEKTSRVFGKKAS